MSRTTVKIDQGRQGRQLMKDGITRAPVPALERKGSDRNGTQIRAKMDDFPLFDGKQSDSRCAPETICASSPDVPCRLRSHFDWQPCLRIGKSGVFQSETPVNAGLI